jgi:hypothetical protein
MIDESDLQCEKHFDPRISIFIPTSIFEDSKKFATGTSIRERPLQLSAEHYQYDSLWFYVH